jgi:hypothetical protein
MGVKYQPESMKIEDLIRNQQIFDENLFKWIKETFATDRRLLQFINDLELKLISKGNNNNNKTKNLNDEQTRITFSSTLDLSDDKVYLYLPGKNKIRRTINQEKKNRKYNLSLFFLFLFRHFQ